MPQSNFIPRRRRSRGVNSVLHIFCEGATEEAYFEAYKRRIHCASVVINALNKFAPLCRIHYSPDVATLSH